MNQFAFLRKNFTCNLYAVNIIDAAVASAYNIYYSASGVLNQKGTYTLLRPTDGMQIMRILR
jgi:hypothetical protein